MLAWFAAHPGVDTVFLSTHTSAEVKKAEGKTMAETARAGYRDEITALLRVVRARRRHPRHPVRARPATCAASPARCRPTARRGRRARARGALALQPDPLAAAARDLRSARVQLIDLTSRSCDARRCYPVVGGALVHRDQTHVTPAFSATLGPFIMRALPR